jgi:hypothetical protein
LFSSASLSFGIVPAQVQPKAQGPLMNNLNISSGLLIASLIWGSIGTGFAVYGWKQKDMPTLFGGIALIAISYFLGSALYMSIVGTLLVGAIIWLKKNL